MKFGSQHGRRISATVSEDFIIYRVCEPDSVVDFEVVCVTDDGV